MPRNDGKPTIAEMVSAVDAKFGATDPRADKPWPATEDCDGCNGHQLGPHRFGCKSRYAAASHEVWVKRHGLYGADVPTGTTMAPREFNGTSSARSLLIRMIGHESYTALTDAGADAVVRRLHAADAA